ncbi:hypothetical protein BV210_13525 [Halorientalis sp. IM1011]|uniref:hypothetical protein n=1 Tax=Halorientalis sp. IM1011 TaxID=1932360 RepID=UPI00097CC559|nr:hypothetical protein [Halorientalis sp. IM1011]AQL43657.1 hypothetical protein BV210_13525 [Halorientalis sp. IM1011]
MRRIALLACLLLLAGCQTGGGPVTPTATTTLAEAPTVSVANGSADPFDLPMFRSIPRANGTVETVTVGTQHDFEGSVAVVVWNDASRNRSIRIKLTYLPTNETLYRRVGVPADEAVEFDLVRSGRYRLSVTTNATTHSLSLGRDTFDCNDHMFGARVGPQGNVSTAEIATEVACGPPGE